MTVRNSTVFVFSALLLASCGANDVTLKSDKSASPAATKAGAASATTSSGAVLNLGNNDGRDCLGGALIVIGPDGKPEKYCRPVTLPPIPVYVPPEEEPSTPPITIPDPEPAPNPQPAPAPAPAPKPNPQPAPAPRPVPKPPCFYYNIPGIGPCRASVTFGN